MSKSSVIKEYVISQLQQLPVCKPNGAHTQWTVRCPFCGDSTDPSHGHLSIRIIVDDDESAMVYRCFKCEAHGLVDANVLSELGVYVDPAYAQDLKNSIRRAYKKNKYTNEIQEAYKVVTPTNSVLVQNKLRYINNRLGLSLDTFDCERLKLIPDFYQFFNDNKIESVNPSIANMLQMHYLGFLSQSNNVITCRSLGLNPKLRRYYKLNINPYNQNPASFYLIPTRLEFISNEPIDIYVAEGTFDIISIHESVATDANPHRSVFAANCGFGPSSILQYLMYNGLLYHARLHLYLDNDKTDDDVRYMMLRRPELMPWLEEIYFHRNVFQGEKDYGVPKEKIKDSYSKVAVNGIFKQPH